MSKYDCTVKCLTTAYIQLQVDIEDVANAKELAIKKAQKIPINQWIPSKKVRGCLTWVSKCIYNDGKIDNRNNNICKVTEQKGK